MFIIKKTSIILFSLVITTLSMQNMANANNDSRNNTNKNANVDNNTKVQHEKIIQTAINNFSSISGQFEQTQKNNKKIILGQFIFNQPNRFIWEYQKPFAQILQSDGKQLYIYDKDLQQITIKKISSEIYAAPIAIFFDAKNWKNNFNYTVKLAESTSKNILSQQQIVLTPKNKDSTYTHLIIDIDNTYTPQGFAFKDNVGNEGYIRIFNLKTKIFKANDFNFTIPKGVDVIKE
jgi:outer membrane lipoprotein carrier protein